MYKDDGSSHFLQSRSKFESPSKLFLLTLVGKKLFQKHHGLDWNEEFRISTKTALVPDMFRSHTDSSGIFWTVDPSTSESRPRFDQFDRDSTFDFPLSQSDSLSHRALLEIEVGNGTERDSTDDSRIVPP